MKTLFLLIAGIILLPNFSFSQKSHDKAKSFTDYTFYIRNAQAGKVLDVAGYGLSATKKNGANVHLWDLDKGIDQRFKFVPAGNGYYFIRFQHTNSNLDVSGCFDGKLFCKTYKKDKGANVQMWKAGNSQPQQWKIEKISYQAYKITNRYSGKVLDASASHIKENGCNVLQWTWKASDNQLWELIDAKTNKLYNKQIK